MSRKVKKIRLARTSTQRSRIHRRALKILRHQNQTVSELLITNEQVNTRVLNATMSTENSLKEELFAEKLSDWINEYRISKGAVNDLLSILNSHGGQSLPKDYRTLLRTDTNIETNTLAGGSFWYNGIKKCLVSIFCNLDRDLELKLNFNIDGLPLYKSSKQTFYPILGSIHGIQSFFPCIMALKLILIMHTFFSNESY